MPKHRFVNWCQQVQNPSADFNLSSADAGHIQTLRSPSSYIPQTTHFSFRLVDWWNKLPPEATLAIDTSVLTAAVDLQGLFIEVYLFQFQLQDLKRRLPMGVAVLCSEDPKISRTVRSSLVRDHLVIDDSRV